MSISSREIIENSPDLKQLFNDGFEVCIKHAHLLISNVPYLDHEKKIKRGTLIFPISMSTPVTVSPPSDHTAHFAGSRPHYADGTPINGIINSDTTTKLADGIVSSFYFSSLPNIKDPDYAIKVRRYLENLSNPAKEIDATVTAQTRRIIENEDDNSPFVYQDTNSGRAQIVTISDKLKNLRIGIIGLGGTGSCILDLVSKTPVKDIHIFDDDEFSLHNAYRAPGAPTFDELSKRSLKVSYLSEIYSRLHKGIKEYPERICSENMTKLNGLDFVFLCVDPSQDKALIVDFLVQENIPFVDTGIDVQKKSDELIGMVNLITVTPDHHSHIGKIPTKDGGDNELYDSNIQIIELNMLNAIAAVIRWKKYYKFYHDERCEHESCYTIGPNMISNGEF
ncbi:MAG: ThiF family adenylyltransferase [Bacteroidales bacterium]|nr:ThiF family adenylyltransferase [Bacteroidales bacterium]